MRISAPTAMFCPATQGGPPMKNHHGKKLLADRNGNGALATAPAPNGVKTLSIGKDCKYTRELRHLQVELVKLQEWIRHEGLRVVVIFEGRDAAGKGGAIKRISECLN